MRLHSLISNELHQIQQGTALKAPRYLGVDDYISDHFYLRKGSKGNSYINAKGKTGPVSSSDVLLNNTCFRATERTRAEETLS